MEAEIEHFKEQISNIKKGAGRCLVFATITAVYMVFFCAPVAKSNQIW